MDQNELGKKLYGNEGILEILKGSAIVCAAAIPFLLGIVYASVFESTLFNKKIKSQEELEKIVKEESKKLKLDHIKINVIYEPKKRRDNNIRKNGDEYELHIKNNFLSTRASVRHEVYHIKKGDCNRKYDILYNLFVEESRAQLYATFGIKI